MTPKLSSGLALAVGLALFVAINMFAGTALRFARADLTEQDLYTLSSGTRRILAQLDEPITLRLFFSESVSAELPPQLDSYARRVRELLEEFEREADGGLVLQVIDPEPYSEAEELAVSFGIRGNLINTAGDTFYFGIAGTNSIDERQTLPTLDPRGESTLEYQLAKLVHDLSGVEKAKVAIISSLPLNGGPATFPGQPPQQAWRIVALLRETFEVEFLNEAGLTSPIASDTDVLLIVHPKGLPDPAQFAIDQYALGGGKVLALVDPFCFFDPPAPGQQPFQAIRNSQLDRLLGAWGVELVPSAVVGDRDLARTLQSGNRLLPYPLWMELNSQVDPELFDADDFVTADLGLVSLFCAGALRASEEGTTEITPMLRTSSAGRTIPAMNLQFSPNPLALAETLLPQFQPVPGEEPSGPLDVAVRISGTFTSAFPDGAPEGWEGTGEVLSESAEPFNAIVISDVDFLNDQLWASQQMTQIGMLQRANNNPILLLNAVDNLSGSNDLLSLRSRGVSRRPFERKEDLAKIARERFLAKDQELEAKLREIDTEIRELQEGADEQGVVRITMQQFDELNDKQEEKVELLRERRRVQHGLKKDIESLGARLKLINIGVVPVLVALAGLAFHRTRRRRIA